MIDWLIERRIAAAERQLGAPLDYLRYVARHSLADLRRLGRLTRLAEQTRHLPVEVVRVATLAGSLADRCSGCVDISLHLARTAGMDEKVIQAVLADRLEELDEPLRDAVLLARGATSGEGVDPTVRERIRRRHGERGLIELSMVVAMHRVYPTLKRALGYAEACDIAEVATA